MAPKDHIKGLARKLSEAKSEGARLRLVEEESRSLLLVFKGDACHY
jgi:hypothetical protein